ncbi:hypothetical protein FHG87_005048 [Trinorchestia longiramus]|nr:hypothetical protein FHG87_005048 [Trinorchestia longiramus]
MLGNKSGFAALVRVEARHAIVTHCILHRHALAIKTLPRRLKDVMSTAIQTVNFIRDRATHHRLFKVFCKDIGSLHNILLYYTEFYTTELGKFWCSMIEPYPLLAKRALQSILPYVTIYLCKAGFPILVAIKTKSRNRLDAADDKRVALSKKSPQFHFLVNKKQQQRSH